VCVNQSSPLVHLKGSAAIVAQKPENLVLNPLSRLRSRFAASFLHSYMNAQSMFRSIFSFSLISRGFAIFIDQTTRKGAIGETRKLKNCVFSPLQMIYNV
jgi:hypothetical protein